MEKFYAEIERFLGELEHGDGPDATSRALHAHQVLDAFVKKLQIVKEYLEQVSDECLLLSEDRNPFPALYDRSFVSGLLRGVDRIEEDLNGRRFRDAGGSENEIERMMEQIDGHIERMYKLGDTLRKTDVLRKKMGG